MSGGVIVTVTLNASLHVSYHAAPAVNGAAAAGPGQSSAAAVGPGQSSTAAVGPGRSGAVTPVSRPRYQAGGRGVAVAQVLHKFGHEVLAAGLAGGVAGELIGQDLARSGVPAEFTQIRGESRRIMEFETGAGILRFGEPGPYVTTEELGRFAADYRRLLGSAAAVVLCGSLPDGLPPDMYASLVRYAAEAGVPAVLDAGGEELLLALRNRPDLVVAEAGDPDAALALLRQGATAAAVIVGGTVCAVTPSAQWTAVTPPAAADDAGVLDRGTLVAGLVPGQVLGWSWPDRLRHAVALAAGQLDLAAYERLLDTVSITS